MKYRFDHLPAPVRERFVRISQDDMDRRAFVRSITPPLTGGRWFFMIAGLLGSLAFAYWLVNEEWGRKDPYFDREVYLGLVAALWVFLTAALGFVYRAVFGANPYREGVYVFANALVHAVQGWLFVVPIERVGRPTIVNRYRNGVYQGSWLQLHDTSEPKKIYTVPCASQSQAEETVVRLDQARQTFARIASARDLQQLESLDPFYECTMSGQWENPANATVPGPRSKPIPLAASLARWLGSIFVAAGITAGLFFAVQSACEANPRPPGGTYYQGCRLHGSYESVSPYGGGTYGRPPYGGGSRYGGSSYGGGSPYGGGAQPAYR